MNKKDKFFHIPHIIPFIKPYKNLLIIMIVLGILSSLIDSIYPLFNQYALNYIIALNKLDTVSLFIVTYIIIIVIQVIFNYISSYLCCKIELYIGRDLKNKAFNHLQTLSFSYFNKYNVGYLHARVMSDTDKIGTLVSWRLMDIVWNLSYIVFMFVVMININVMLTLYLLLLIPIAIVFILFFQKRLVSINRIIRETNSKITSNFNEGITGMKAIKTLVVEDKIGNEFKEDTLEMKRVSIKNTHYSAIFTSTVTMFSSIALSIVLWQGGMLNKQALLSIGTLSVFMTYALSMIEPIQRIIETITSLISVQVNIERLTSLLESQSDVIDRDDVILKYGDVFNQKYENYEDIKGDIEFKDVTFKYPDGDEIILDHFNLKIDAGLKVAIVGETGAGKSTLVNLACRFFEVNEGQILIDGKDIKERSQYWLHSHIGYVLQTPHLFSGSVRDNIKYGHSDASDEEIWEALKLVKADSIVLKMGGLDSDVGEGGGNLSTGEKQLLSFARAIIGSPKILVLDEATSSIDTMTEKKIQDAINTVIKGRTSFIIAHRLSTIVDSDIILVVKNGKIIEKGTHHHLMESKGYYYNLYKKQYDEKIIEEIY